METPKAVSFYIASMHSNSGDFGSILSQSSKRPSTRRKNSVTFQFDQQAKNDTNEPFQSSKLPNGGDGYSQKKKSELLTRNQPDENTTENPEAKIKSSLKRCKNTGKNTSIKDVHENNTDTSVVINPESIEIPWGQHMSSHLKEIEHRALIDTNAVRHKDHTVQKIEQQFYFNHQSPSYRHLKSTTPKRNKNQTIVLASKFTNIVSKKVQKDKFKVCIDTTGRTIELPDSNVDVQFDFPMPQSNSIVFNSLQGNTMRKIVELQKKLEPPLPSPILKQLSSISACDDPTIYLERPRSPSVNNQQPEPPKREFKWWSKIKNTLFPKPPDHWMADQECSSCASCSADFTFLKRKHHCRCCGYIFCGDCSPNLQPFPGYSKLQRVCNNCACPYTTT